jgi:hypothetical protein
LALTDIPQDPDQIPRCPHCDEPLKKWASPEGGSWDTPWQWGCFDDDCPYYRDGWEWMKEQFQQNASYRFRMDPTTGETGPLPVWSSEAMKNKILDD